MSEAATTETAAPKAPRAKRIQGNAYDTRISYGLDGEKKRYGAEENNPKRGGAAERFKKYAAGKTIQDALTAGMKPEDIGYDLKKGYIVAETGA